MHCSLQTGSLRSGSWRSPDCKWESSEGGRQELAQLSWAAWHPPWERRAAPLGACAGLPVPLARRAAPSRITSRAKAGAAEPCCINSTKKEEKDSSESSLSKISIDNIYHHTFYSLSHVACSGRGELGRIKSIII